MLFQQIFLPGLAQASYLVASEGEAIVVDPRRDVDDYLDFAAHHDLRLKHVLLTHVHADFVAGHTELAARCGAAIGAGARVEYGFGHAPLAEGDVVTAGTARITVLETPGHTPESLCFLVRDEAAPDTPPRLLTGDTLFIGDVGRPDLVGGQGLGPPEMARMLYRSLREKILPLDDAVEVWPGHGAGSACGKAISSETHSTIGNQRLTNYALADMTEARFVELVTEGLGSPPPYFAHAAALNRAGPALLRDLPQPAPWTVETFAARIAEDGAVVLDVRDARSYGEGHVPGALNLGLTGSFEKWAGTLIPIGAPIWIVAAGEDAVREAWLRLARIGHETVAGALAGGFAAWRDAGREVERVDPIEVSELARRLKDGGWQVVDVRRPEEYSAGHLPGAVLAPLGEDDASLDRLDPERPTVLVCGTGYRSSAAAKFLRDRGFRRLANLVGGTDAWVQAGLPYER